MSGGVDGILCLLGERPRWYICVDMPYHICSHGIGRTWYQRIGFFMSIERCIWGAQHSIGRIGARGANRRFA